MGKAKLLRFFEKIINRLLLFVGLRLQKCDREYPELWGKDNNFQSLFKEIENRTLVSQERCFMLYQFAKYAQGKHGDFAEVGVYKGGTAKLIAKTCPDKCIYLFDTFSGMPTEDRSIDIHKLGDFSDTSLHNVRRFLRDCDNVVIIPGFFPDTSSMIGDKVFYFVHIDVDIYKSVKDSLEFFYSRMIEGGVMVFDDYGWKNCPGIKKAISEFLLEKRGIPIIVAKYQCVLLKVCLYALSIFIHNMCIKC